MAASLPLGPAVGASMPRPEAAATAPADGSAKIWAWLRMMHRMISTTRFFSSPAAVGSVDGSPGRRRQSGPISVASATDESWRRGTGVEGEGVCVRGCDRM